MNLASVKSLFRNHRRPAMLVSLALAAVLVFTAFRLGRSDGVQYFTAPVEQGEVLTVVNATGTIDAVTTVEVGSQVSGMIEALHADFNSEVKKGQIVAQIDPAPFRARVVQAQAELASASAGVKSLQADLQVAQANVEKNRAALRESELKLRRMLELFEQGIASVEQRDSVQIAQETAVANLRAAEAQVNQTRARIEQQRAQVTQRRAQLEQTGFDLQRATIRAPINGTVIARNVDVGQTVAASLQAPTLFTIAQDLTQMLVYAKTDESDVGKIRVGALATFKVDSFPRDTFRGRVKQVRMNATEIQNVVTYDTIIEFENPGMKLLPGMTAYVTIPVAHASDVVKIPNGALRYKPEITERERLALLQKYGLAGPPGKRGGKEEKGTVQAQEKEDESDQPDASGRRQRPGGDERTRRRAPSRAQRQQQHGHGGGSGFQAPPQQGPGAEGAWQIVWKLNPDNTLQPVRIKTGLTDFTFTAMLDGELKPDDPLVIGQTLDRKQESARRLRRSMRRF